MVLIALHPKTLFHLVPTNQVAHDALLHPDNKRFVSSTGKGQLGLEIGYHVPSTPRGHVITRLGRNADLILRESSPEVPMSAVHVAFEINPDTYLVVLSVRSKRVSSVSFTPISNDDPGGNTKEDVATEDVATEDVAIKDVAAEIITGDGVMLYGQDYSISIASYTFELVWRSIATSEVDNESLKALAVQGYEASLLLLKDLRSRDQPTKLDLSEAVTWHQTRLNTAKGAHLRDLAHLRKERGKGAFGVVYEAFDKTSGYRFAIKVVNLDSQPPHALEAARAMLHREIKVMERLKHEHIIEYLGNQLFDTLRPEIFMPLRDGNLTSLAMSMGQRSNREQLCAVVLEQMLGALDYLASEGLIHRDIKPDNILYLERSRGGRLFQLADFGLANYRSLATTFCGTPCYQAPELWPTASGVDAGQSPKLDVWSLFASIIAVRDNFKEFPPSTSDYRVVLRTLQAKAVHLTKFEPMVRLQPDRRASAAQMLVTLFDGRGLTTKVSRIPPIEPRIEPSNPPRPRTDGSRPQPQQTDPSRLATVYPPRRHAPRTDQFHIRKPPAVPLTRGGNLAQPTAPRLQPIRAHRGGVNKNRAEPPYRLRQEQRPR